uniref:Uncharacterized protein n=1 Tax=Siphoviridae sp. ct5co22 TaxID=2826294 RepID=A0A8S5QUX3_9CAUD|nr:MAG TPA: hypothetical protein [Siphoviridae sp. ct5co22]
MTFSFWGSVLYSSSAVSVICSVIFLPSCLYP